MSKGMIIAGFATVGKSYLGRKYSNVIDLESSNYKYKQLNMHIPIEQRKGTKRELNTLWPNNYYEAIKEACKIYDVVLVQLKPQHLDYFDQHQIKYSIAYPDIENWDLVEEKCIKRGNNDVFIKKLKTVFYSFFKDVEKRDYEKLYVIQEQETLESVLLKNGVELKFDDLV